MNRREVLKGSSALVAAAVLPAVPVAAASTGMLPIVNGGTGATPATAREVLGLFVNGKRIASKPLDATGFASFDVSGYPVLEGDKLHVALTQRERDGGVTETYLDNAGYLTFQKIPPSDSA